ncbi:MAG: peptide-methionine (S)-S-oxide reductase MsrA [Alphaproteobacteria bacterium]|nr:peptide-methionine (S)-S-oxide reductase MsrA [Alphaproteobacteria bacterium]MBE8220128.1 peptide-methionine (S)-S-oxide reductase MsrA [Alphaproteobacteria bacterium]
MKHILYALIFSTILASPLATTQAQAEQAIAYFAGGCFWCTESDFEQIEGVGDVISGYMGGAKVRPAYRDVASGATQHRETVKVPYDTNIVSYQELLSAFWRMHDPSDGTGSFVDRGRQYSTAIYYANTKQKRLAKGAIKALEASGKFNTIATSLEKADKFYTAEDYHQDYYRRNAVRYKYYRFRSGRDQFIKRVWEGDDKIYQAAR